MKVMQNQPSSNTDTTIATPAPEATSRRARRNPKGWRRGPIIVAGAVAAIGAMVGTGFVVQGAVAAQNDRIAETRALTEAANSDVQQLDAHGGILEARAVKQAEDTLGGRDRHHRRGPGQGGCHGAHRHRRSPRRVQAARPRARLRPRRLDGVRMPRPCAPPSPRQIASPPSRPPLPLPPPLPRRPPPRPPPPSESSSSSSGSRPGAPANPSAAQAIARDMLLARGWGDDQFGCLVELWNHESGWNVYASNPSGAYGIPQALPGSKMATAGADWETNPATQISWGLGYITGRYGTPCGAWDTFSSQGWY